MADLQEETEKQRADAGGAELRGRAIFAAKTRKDLNCWRDVACAHRRGGGVRDVDGTL